MVTKPAPRDTTELLVGMFGEHPRIGDAAAGRVNELDGAGAYWRHRRGSSVTLEYASFGSGASAGQIGHQRLWSKAGGAPASALRDCTNDLRQAQLFLTLERFNNRFFVSVSVRAVILPDFRRFATVRLSTYPRFCTDRPQIG